MLDPAPQDRSGPRPEPEAPAIPGYEIEGALGRGASGTVFRARQVAVERLVALKVLHAELSANRRLVRRLQREARTTAKLAHPNIVSAIDMGETEGRWWYAMELVEGPSLALRLRQEGRLKEREALRLFIPLCEALVHLWEHGVVHRDIKPANILIDQTGRARLADLGLAFADDDPALTSQGATVGTPHYISPEQAVDGSAADVRSDIWSFGATLFHAVCGRPPFKGESAAEVLSNVLRSRIPDPSEIEGGLSKGLALILRKCLTRDPDSRYQSPRELLLDLERVRERRSPHVQRRSLDPVLKERDPARLQAWIALAVLALGSAAAWGLWAARRGPEGAVGAGPEGPVSYAPLETLAARASERPELVAQHLLELRELRPSLPEAQAQRWAEVERQLRETLREVVHSVQREFEAEVSTLLEARNFDAAQRLLEQELDLRVVRETGLHVSDLAGEGTFIDPWLNGQRARVRSAVDGALRGLERGLETWRDSSSLEVERLMKSQRWSEAYRRLSLGDEEILEAAGFGEARFPPERLDNLLATYRTELRLRRQSYEDDWTLLDRGLRRWLETRTQTLEAALRSGEIVAGASDELALAFEREMASRGLSPTQAPEHLPFTALDKLEESAASLGLLEEQLREESIRGEYEETRRRCETHWRNRDYETALGLWQKLQDRLAALPGSGGHWRETLASRVEARRQEARLLYGLLLRVAQGVLARDGQEVDLWVGSILHPGRRLIASPDPLEKGFRLEGLQQSFALRELSSRAFEMLADFDARGEASPEERFLRALFLERDGRAREAREVLRSGPLPEGDQAQLVVDLRLRITDAIERQGLEAEARRQDAQEYLELLSGALIENSPEVALNMVEVLLDDFGDIAEVVARREELTQMRRRLLSRDRSNERADFLTVYDPSRLEFPRLHRARLDFDFARSEVGTWDLGGWVFDGAGWTPQASVRDWEEFESQRSPRLAIRPPLDLDTGYFEVAVRFELLAASHPPQMLLVSVAGMHAALIGPGLPGGDRSHRWLTGSGELAGFLSQLREGAGERPAVLLEPGQEHEIVLRGSRGGGRLSLFLDGKLLGDKQAKRPEEENWVEIRSWERLRLLSVSVEGNR